uniref:Ionotropic glutamate receptor C-terminal domain-containing protein n=1 Tax=Anopheles maculatus TaxID=74869 RepID=A0A182S783_9DIPT
MESTSIEYIVERECDVTQIGGLLDDKGYGIAMRKNSPYRSALSEAVLRLQEQGVLTSLKRKWWKEKRGGGACSNTMEEGGALALELANVGGVFVLLIVGCVAALFVSFCEMFCDVHSRTRELKVGPVPPADGVTLLPHSVGLSWSHMLHKSPAHVSLFSGTRFPKPSACLGGVFFFFYTLLIRINSHVNNCNMSSLLEDTVLFLNVVIVIVVDPATPADCVSVLKNLHPSRLDHRKMVDLYREFPAHSYQLYICPPITAGGLLLF